jgi:hypothetical protein
MSKTTKTPGRKRGRKPVDLVASTGYRTPQDAVWEAVRKLKEFTLADVMVWMVKEDIKVNQTTARSYIVRLERGRFIQVISSETLNRNTQRHTYRLINDVGLHAPRLTKDGIPTLQGKCRENMWRSMKIMGDFNYRELAESSSTPEVSVKDLEARDYVRHLFGAGYLQLTTPAKKNPGTPARYRLIRSKNTGPHAPMIQRVKRVFDPNLNKVVGEENEHGNDRG